MKIFLPDFFSCTNINCDLCDTTEAQDAKNLTVKKKREKKKNNDRLFLAQPQALDYFTFFWGYLKDTHAIFIIQV